jgi:CcdB protein
VATCLTNGDANLGIADADRIPVRQPCTPRPMARPNPIFEIDGASFVMVTQAITAVSRRELGEPVGRVRVGEDRHYDHHPSPGYAVVRALFP